MNRQSLIIISIIAVGSILSGLAYGISNGSITTENLTVTGNCIGCSGEGDYTNYNTVALNTTIYSSPDTFGSLTLLVGNDGHIESFGHTNVGLVLLNGTVVFVHSSIEGGISFDGAQSQTGKYNVLMNGDDNIIAVYKNGVFLQTLGINQTQFKSGSLSTYAGTIGISSNGKYIGIIGEDSSLSNDRLLIFEGN